VRIYTLEEARAALPEVITLVTEMRDAFVELRALRASIEAQLRGASGDGNLLADPWDESENRVAELQAQLQRSAGELGQRGIEVKDPERGLIDFFSEREGRVVYLCYLLGEPDIAYWHDLEAGFAGRQPLEE
jgi:hypothetical protein